MRRDEMGAAMAVAKAATAYVEEHRGLLEAIAKDRETIGRSNATRVDLFDAVEAWRTLIETPKARVILFRRSGKYYTEEDWRVPEGAIGPYDMARSPDWRRIDGGPVLVDSQEPWGYPHLFPAGEES